MTRRTTGLLAAVAAIALVATACGDDSNDDATLNDGADAVDVSPDSEPTDADEPTPGDSPDDDATGDGTSGGDEPGTGDVIDPSTDHPITAQPGRWAVADAGFVEFDVTADGLVLVDVTEAGGWSSGVDEESSEEIEVDFRRDNIDMDAEIELDDGRLEVDINTDIEGADPGVYELGQAGSMEFAVDGDRLDLRDVVVSDGWDLRMDDESDDEIEFRLTNGNERWHVEIELDDGQVELGIDYRVRDNL